MFVNITGTRVDLMISQAFPVLKAIVLSYLKTMFSCLYLDKKTKVFF